MRVLEFFSEKFGGVWKV